jgi:hypothetical protein
MAQSYVVAQRNLIGVFSFTTGFVASPPQRPTGEEEILRHALWLERHGHNDAALAFLELRCPKR